MDKNKIVIYQVLPRLWGNRHSRLTHNGTKEQNGVGKFSDFTAKRLSGIRALGATHVWYTGILEHATLTDYSAIGIRRDNAQVVKGNAGSPYAVKDYYDVDPDLANNPGERMKEFEELVRRTHDIGLKVIIDLVPNHVAREYHSDAAPAGKEDFGANDDKGMNFSPANNFYYIGGCRFVSPDQKNAAVPYEEYPAKATGNDCFNASPGRFDWYDTAKLNYGVDILAGRVNHFNPMPDTWQKMYDIMEYWCQKGVDGFRCDMSEMVPVNFWHYAIGRLKRSYPGVIFIAEIYNPSVYNAYLNYGGFDFLYDKVGLYDKLRAVMTGAAPACDITYTWQVLDDLKPRMLSFMENHDEQRIASSFFAGDARNGKPAMIVSALMNVNPVMIYFGQEYGEKGMDDEGYSRLDGRTSIYDYWSVEKIRKALYNSKNISEEDRQIFSFYKRLLSDICREEAVREGLFYDLTYCNLNMGESYDSRKLYSFLRRSKNELLLIIANFADEETHAQINIPEHAFKFLGIQEGMYSCVDLLNTTSDKEHFGCKLSPNCKMDVVVPAFSGCVLKIM